MRETTFSPFDATTAANVSVKSTACACLVVQDGAATKTTPTKRGEKTPISSLRRWLLSTTSAALAAPQPLMLLLLLLLLPVCPEPMLNRGRRFLPSFLPSSPLSVTPSLESFPIAGEEGERECISKQPPPNSHSRNIMYGT